MASETPVSVEILISAPYSGYGQHKLEINFRSLPVEPNSMYDNGVLGCFEMFWAIMLRTFLNTSFCSRGTPFWRVVFEVRDLITVEDPCYMLLAFRYISASRSAYLMVAASRIRCCMVLLGWRAFTKSGEVTHKASLTLHICLMLSKNTSHLKHAKACTRCRLPAPLHALVSWGV